MQGLKLTGSAMKSTQARVKIYTDGACSGNPGPGAWAAILIFGEIEKEISGFAEETTNNRMEMQAAIEGLKALKQACSVDLYSDSAYLVSGFNKGWLENWQKKGWQNAAGNPVSNIDLWQELLSLSSQHDISWHKVKGHADNPYNNRCDELARNLIKRQRNVWPEALGLDEPIAEPQAPKQSSLPTAQLQHFAHLDEEILSDTCIFEGKIIDFHHYKIKTAAGREAWREVVHHGGGVGIVALTPDHEVLLVHQYRLAAGQVLQEIPAGCLEAQEDPLEAAKRELEEETGYRARTWYKLGEFFVSPGYTNEIIHLFLAVDLELGKQHLDPDEYLNVVLLPLNQAIEDVRRLKIHDAKTLIGLSLTEDWLRQKGGQAGGES